MSFGRFLLKLVPKKFLLDVSFHNFYNAITVCYMADEDLCIRQINDQFLKIFNIKKDQARGIHLYELFKRIGLSEEVITEFKQQLETQGFAKIPELKITIDSEERYFSLFSTYTKDMHLPFLSGLQGQLIDRTKEVKLKQKTEKLANNLQIQQEKVQEQNKNLESLSTKLAKYLSPQVYGSIFSGKKEVTISFERKRLTVFFSDIKDFTSTTESMESEELAKLLNSYLDSMSKIALKHGGTIDKFIGDAILIFFGDPETLGPKQDAIHCIKMALEMQELMGTLRQGWFESGITQPLHIRIGINSGYCTVGNFGSESRLDYTIIGGQVNLASRLEGITEPDTILISHECYGLVREEVYCKPAGTTRVKGIPHDIKVYRVIDLYENIHKTEMKLEEAINGFSINLDTTRVENYEEATRILHDAAKLIEKSHGKFIKIIKKN